MIDNRISSTEDMVMELNALHMHIFESKRNPKEQRQKKQKKRKIKM
jgi:hypothetical protein